MAFALVKKIKFESIIFRWDLNLTFAAKLFMRLYFIFTFLLISVTTKAQFFEQQRNINNSNSFPPNISFLKQHKVKSITCVYATKEEGKRIQPKNHIKKTIYNSQGFPQYELEIFLNDSTEQFFYYLSDTLHIIRKFSPKEIQATYLTFDKHGQKIKEVRCKEFPADIDAKEVNKEYFKLGKQEVIWRESYFYESLSKNQIRKKTLNDNMIVYKEGILYSNELGLTTGEISRYTATGVSENTTLSYSEKRKILEKIFFTDVTGAFEEKTNFTYDENGNLAGAKLYRNGILQKESIYFFDKNGIFPEAILTKYPNRTTLDMQTIQIEFY